MNPLANLLRPPQAGTRTYLQLHHLYPSTYPDDRDRQIRVDSDVNITFTLTNDLLNMPVKILFSDSSLGEGYVLNIGQVVSLERPRIDVDSIQLATIAEAPTPESDEALQFRLIREEIKFA